MTGLIKDFNELYWDKLLDRIVVDKGKKLMVVFIGGYNALKIYDKGRKNLLYDLDLYVLVNGPDERKRCKCGWRMGSRKEV